MLKFEKFKKEHFAEYKNWFKHKTIREALYGIDDEWLEYILTDTRGEEYAIFLKDEMIAVVGLVFPNLDHSFYAINNIAINPSKLRQGWGSKVLNDLFKLHALGRNEYWVSFVENKNVLAQCFFEKNGWKRIEEDDMIRYELRLA